MSPEYKKEYEESINNPETFWGRAAEEIQWHKPYLKVLDDSSEVPRSRAAGHLIL